MESLHRLFHATCSPDVLAQLRREGTPKAPSRVGAGDVSGIDSNAARFRRFATQLVVLLFCVSLASGASTSGIASAVAVLRVPDGGIQPQIATDAKGGIHMVYFAADPAHGDLYYVRSRDGGRLWSAPLRVNSEAGSAIAIGNIRGAHIAVGRNGRVHVAWNGSSTATPKLSKGTPMLYSRLNGAGTGLEAQRNLIHTAAGLDGGGAIAADAEGNVYVFWHAPLPGTEGEASRRVWIAASKDDGATFAPERVAWDSPTGVCGCCGMNAYADARGDVYVLFRSATRMVHRDMHLLVSRDEGASFSGVDVAPWNVGYCVMSSAAFAGNGREVVAGWEREKQVSFARVANGPADVATPRDAPGLPNGRKYPALAVNARGETLLAWTEGMSWKKGGSVAWQVYRPDGSPLGESGHADGVPPWSLVAAFSRPGGGFAVVY